MAATEKLPGGKGGNSKLYVIILAIGLIVAALAVVMVMNGDDDPPEPPGGTDPPDGRGVSVSDVTLTFDLDDGSSEQSITKSAGGSFEFPITGLREGYRFDGWATPAGDVITATTSTVPDTDTKYTAKWTKWFVITFHLDGGDGTSTAIIAVDHKATLHEEPTKDGYRFDGWQHMDDPIYDAGDEVDDVTEDMYMVAKWTKWPTISFNRDGGQGPATAITAVDNKATIHEEPPTKSGHRFDGWKSSVDGKTYAAAEKLENITTDITMVAQWTKWPVITFDLDDGEGTSTTAIAIDRKAKLHDAPSKDGHGFLGWFAGDVRYDANQELTDIEEDMDLVAKWVKWPVITFDLNGGEGTSTTVIATDRKAKLHDAPTWLGRIFDGWSFAGSKYDANQELTNIEDDMDLVAEWITLKVTVKFDLNGGSDGPASSDEYMDSRYVIPAGPTPSDPSDYFIGWSYDGETYSSGNTFNIPPKGSTYEITFTAQWSSWPVVTFILNGGPGNVNAVIAEEGEATLPNAPEWNECRFDGWKSSSDSTTYPAGQELTGISDSITMTAQWTKWPVLTFDLNGGSGATPAKIIAKDGKATLPGIQTLEGHRFDGWMSGVLYVAGQELTGIAADMHMVAQWTAWTIVKFDLNNGIGTSDDLFAVDWKVKLHPAPIREGHTFKGWLYSNVIYDADSDLAGLSGEIVTVYASWIPYKMTITLNAMGGSGSPAESSYTYDSLTWEVPSSTREGYTFLGWSTVQEYSEGNETLYAIVGLPYLMPAPTKPNDTMTLYAQWEIILRVGIGTTFEFETVETVDGVSDAPENRTSTIIGQNEGHWLVELETGKTVYVMLNKTNGAIWGAVDSETSPKNEGATVWLMELEDIKKDGTIVLIAANLITPIKKQIYIETGMIGNDPVIYWFEHITVESPGTSNEKTTKRTGTLSQESILYVEPEEYVPSPQVGIVYDYSGTGTYAELFNKKNITGTGKLIHIADLKEGGTALFIEYNIDAVGGKIVVGGTIITTIDLFEGITPVDGGTVSHNGETIPVYKYAIPYTISSDTVSINLFVGKTDGVIYKVTCKETILVVVNIDLTVTLD